MIENKDESLMIEANYPVKGGRILLYA